MNREQKNELAAVVKQKVIQAGVTFFADYRGLKATEADQLRKILREKKVEAKVVKNNVARIAIEQAKLGDEPMKVAQGIFGPTLMMFSMGDPAAAAKALVDFAKNHEAFQLKDGFMGSRRLAVAEIEQLAKLPSREVMLSMLLSVFNAPARNFVSVLAAVPRGLVTVLSAIKDKKEKQS